MISKVMSRTFRLEIQFSHVKLEFMDAIIWRSYDFFIIFIDFYNLVRFSADKSTMKWAKWVPQLISKSLKPQ